MRFGLEGFPFFELTTTEINNLKETTKPRDLTNDAENFQTQLDIMVRLKKAGKESYFSFNGFTVYSFELKNDLSNEIEFLEKWYKIICGITLSQVLSSEKEPYPRGLCDEPV